MHKYIFNFNYFKKINSEDKAYWLGFITADGYVSEKIETRGLSIALKKSDTKHLFKFKKSIDYTGPIRLAMNKATLTIYSKDLVKDLVNLGIRQGKSLTVKSWKGPKKYLCHYWRGVFDGDGCFSQYHKKRKSGKIYYSWYASLVGNKYIIKSFSIFVKRASKSKFKKGTKVKCKKVYRMIYSGIQPAQTIAKLLYNNSHIYLGRKKVLSEKIIKTKLKPPIIRHLPRKYLIKMYKKYHTWKKVAKILKVSKGGLFKHTKKLKLSRCSKVIRHYKLTYLEALHRKYITWKKVSNYLSVSLSGLNVHLRKLRV